MYVAEHAAAQAVESWVSTTMQKAAHRQRLVGPVLAAAMAVGVVGCESSGLLARPSGPSDGDGWWRQWRSWCLRQSRNGFT